MSDQVAAAKASEQAASRAALMKLLFFAATLAILPISSYFFSEKYVWSGNSNYAAITAICAANIVLIAYIVVSLMEDKQSFKEAEEKKLSETKKER
ncbi:uncharacterized protein BJ212DRAFT_487276 [Suillus subaureus]|uniref:Vacuolar ATPase assembly integral membrane protein VMA21 n=1 Tax=Suillus subaureus TaxID=48587 RepID=A0A9P7DH87_9AGAM|nr:uncharacterized protein BJ212DRAFT_769973 [Suillus subaureus]XP_041190169.1 uncharacterized protein BJ212DRAFT_487276 [Suillus subaureus]KAG1793373.1 hypothetical protein BJ212DRAFT_769973 [Suillus subaureus]KAG1811748.1 hypothetical protein BJ212DRAFT_487276 [Suillus subaureus]